MPWIFRDKRELAPCSIALPLICRTTPVPLCETTQRPHRCPLPIHVWGEARAECFAIARLCEVCDHSLRPRTADAIGTYCAFCSKATFETGPTETKLAAEVVLTCRRISSVRFDEICNPARFEMTRDYCLSKWPVNDPLWSFTIRRYPETELHSLLFRFVYLPVQYVY